MGQLALGLLSFGVSAVQAVAGYAGQQQMYQQNKRNAEQSWRNQQEQITKREMQESDALRQKQRVQEIEEAQAVASVETRAASSGVSGVSLNNLINDVRRRSEFNKQTEITNTRWIVDQLQQERKGINAQAQSRINSVPQPSPLSLIAGIGGAALSGYRTYNEFA